MEQEKSPLSKPKLNVSAQRELDKAEEKFEQYNDELKALASKDQSSLPVQQSEPQTKLSTREIDRNNEIYLKPEKIVGSPQKFNEKFREEYNYKKEYVNFIAEHKELIGEAIETWTRPYGGMSAEFWKVPTNKPVWGPRYLAERISECSYVRYRTEDKVSTGTDGRASYYGGIIGECKIQRLDARPVPKKRSVYMGASSF